MPAESSLTPMFRQYRTMKAEHPGTLLLFRMGDFYEMFYEDAVDASRVLELALTARGKGTAHEAPMCGFPHHQIDAYTARLVRAGRRVAVCEQVEDPRKAKGLVRREVIRVVTPGTLTDPGELDEKEPAWIASVAEVGGVVGAAFADLSTGSFLAWQSSDGPDAREALVERLQAFSPREIVVAEELPARERLAELGRAALTPVDGYAFLPDPAGELLRRHFGVASLDGFGLRDAPVAVAAAGGLLAYLRDTQKHGLEHLDGIALHEPRAALALDRATRRNLEIERSLRDGARAGSLIHAVDRTRTAAGARLLRAWILEPLLDAREIARRHDAVEELVERAALRETMRSRLEAVRDIERLTGRIVAASAGPRELVALRASLESVPALVESGSTLAMAFLRETLDGLDPCADLEQRLAAALVDQPPAGAKDGGVLRDGFHAELDELRAIRRDGSAWITALEAREREATGIASLKVRFNKVFGYYIEISRSNLDRVPDRYTRKQTIAGGERYVTPELKDYESKVLHAQERIVELEYELFAALRTEIAAHAHRLKATARALARLDVVCAFAELAVREGYCRPRVSEGLELRIAGGRHPVVEATLGHGRFVPNDTSLDPPASAIGILTGPNMGGKSTYLRQVALIVVLAQAGSFVPAESAEIGIVDRVFCRVGASDSLAEGQSTFMVEMTETANILHHAGPRSLVLLDEIGRGTSTFDGLAIAWAVAEHLHGRAGGAPRTLFATHYHEMTELAVALPGVRNLRMAVRERGHEVVFTHRVESGAADRSYGIHVARLAGVPAAVLARAREILENLEKDEFGGDGLPRRARRGGSTRYRRGETPLFALAEPEPRTPPPDPSVAEILAELRACDPDRLTPIDALQRLDAWVRRLRTRGDGA
ncbi:MAG TPA: DNA mismatch repair protein MutS [Candidatus Polarisedimenticolaceae bacterium]